MKNAIWYKNTWLMPNSKCFELYQEWQKTKDPDTKKKFEQHFKDTENKSKLLVK